VEVKRATAERFARIEAGIAAILRVLSEHSHMPKRLLEAVREQTGVKGQP
jgi:hypothetical protein